TRRSLLAGRGKRHQYPTKDERRKSAPSSRSRSLSFISRIFGDRRQRARLSPLYAAIVAAGRDPAWYREGQVPDTIDGRFDMVAAILALVLLRLEREGDRNRKDS